MWGFFIRGNHYLFNIKNYGRVRRYFQNGRVQIIESWSETMDKTQGGSDKCFTYVIMKELLNSITDTRMVYLLMSIVLLAGYTFDVWGVVIFVAFMLNVGVWTGFCPSKWFFGKCGFKKSEL